MTSERLLQNFDRLIDTPDAVPRLRRFILDLAVRGKLVEQNPEDEPAGELVKRIEAEKKRLVKFGEIKPQKPLPPVSDSEAPFEISKSWEWVRLGSIGDWGSGSTPSRGNSGYYGGGITWLKSGELNDKSDLHGSEETVTELALQKCSFRLNKAGDVLIAMYGATIGKLAILGEPALTNQAVCGCTPFEGIFNRYLYLFLLSRREKFHGQSEGGAQPNISKVKIVNSLFALPPLAEQHRIVAKVDELMTLCDELEAAQAKRERRRDRLVAATLHGLNGIQTTNVSFPLVGNPSEERLRTSWSDISFKDSARFYFSHLPRLTTRPEHIQQLRQTILNLAVRGKLVPQDPKDEPATELLSRVNKWRAEAVRKKLIRDPRKPLKTIALSEEPYELPGGWAWARLGEVIYIHSGDGLTAENMKGGDIPVYGGNGINGYHDAFNIEEPTIVIGRVGYYCGSIHVTSAKSWVTDNAFITKHGDLSYAA